MDSKSNIRLGYACISALRPDLKVNREIKMVTVNKFKTKKLLVAHLKELSLLNLRDTLEILKENVKNNIYFYRMTSCLFPHMTNNLIKSSASYFKCDMKFAAPIIADIRSYALQHKIRLTFHSQPYFHLESADTNTFKQTLMELKMYNNFLDLLALPDMCIIVHVGKGYNSFIERYLSLRSYKRQNLMRYVVVENTEHNNNAELLLQLCEKHSIPYCFDFFHNSVHNTNICKIDNQFILRCCKTWTNFGTPKFHVSNQKSGARRGSHSDYIDIMPPELISFLKLQISIDIMFEVKMKDKAVLLAKKLLYVKN
jgi:UV DNA damage endonuclease